MNHAAFLAVLVAMSFALPLIIRGLFMMNPNLLTLASIVLVAAVILQTWFSRKAKPSTDDIVTEESPIEFSSPLRQPLKPEEDYHASL